MAFCLHYRPIGPTTARLFDTLRGTSALLVVLGHTVFYFFPAYPRFVVLMLKIVDVAVLMFFVISGFMITSSILRQICGDPRREFDVKRFARNRLFRLYPSLLAALVLMGIAYSWLITLHPEYKSYWSALQALFTPLFLLDLGVGVPAPVINKPLWSLSHEFWFYVAGALICMVLVSSRWYKLAGCLGLLFIVYWVGTVAWYLGLLVWLSGALIAYFYHRPTARTGPATTMTVRPGLIVAMILCTAFIASWAILSQEKSGLEMYLFGLFLAVVVGGLVNRSVVLDAATLVSPVSPAQYNGTLTKSIPFCIRRLVAMVAATAPFSYTLFVIHFPLLLIWFELTRQKYVPIASPSLRALAFLILVIVLSKVLGRFLEKSAVRSR